MRSFRPPRSPGHAVGGRSLALTALPALLRATHCRAAMGIAGGSRGAMGFAGAVARGDQSHALDLLLNPRPVDEHSVRTAT